MICFRDMTFCSAFPTKCANGKCRRAFTDAAREEAREWWGKNGDAPVAYSDLSKGCTYRVAP